GFAVVTQLHGFYGHGIAAFFVRVGHGVVLRAVGCGPPVVPLLDFDVGELHGSGVERVGEGHGDLVFFHAQRFGAIERFAGVADALEAAVFLGGGGPAFEAADVKLAVDG